VQLRLLNVPLPAALAAGCQVFSAEQAKAVAELAPTRGHAAAGTATFEQFGDRVHLHAEVTGLRPGREHGFHVHEHGDCSSGDGASAKGHFNPFGKPHAHYSTPERHAGDLPSLKADAQGRAVLEVQLDVITVVSGPSGITGRGLIVHEAPDDYRTQPAGDSGARIACGVIRRAPKAN
jgi:Cu-Zn family superoxide dismutase